MKIFESTLPNNYSKGLFEEKNYDLAAEHTDKIADVVFTATANLLSGAKDMNHATSFDLTEIDGSLIASAIVQFFPNEDASQPGNWNLVWTFNEEDIPDGTNRISFNNPQSAEYFRAIAGEKYGIQFRDPSAMITLSTYLLTHIKKWLDENAKEGEEVSVEQEGVFQARVAIENGEKVFAIEPDGQIKRLIKDDAVIEK